MRVSVQVHLEPTRKDLHLDDLGARRNETGVKVSVISTTLGARGDWFESSVSRVVSIWVIQTEG